MQNNIVYKNGFNYLEIKYGDLHRDCFDYKFRYALLEYYRGRMEISRKYLLKSIKLRPIKLLLVLRYLLVSFLGNGIIGYLRKNNILNKMNIILNKYLKRDLQSINSKLMEN